MLNEIIQKLCPGTVANVDYEVWSGEDGEFIKFWRTNKYAQPTQAQIMAASTTVNREQAETAARGRRDVLLAASDWVALRAMETGDVMPDDVRQYRQSLRDLPESAGWPFSIEWPQIPAILKV